MVCQPKTETKEILVQKLKKRYLKCFYELPGTFYFKKFWAVHCTTVKDDLMLHTFINLSDKHRQKKKKNQQRTALAKCAFIGTEIIKFSSPFLQKNS